MKKILVMAAMMIATLTASAQNTSLKIYAGASFGDITHIKGHDYKAGFIGGAELEYRASNLIGISGGLFYSMQGASFNNPGIEINGGKFDAKYNYLNVPVLVNFHVTKGLVLKTGLQPGFLLSAKEGNLDVKNNLNKIDLSIPFGIGYEFNNGLMIDTRYNCGMTKLYKNDFRDDDKSSCNSVFQVTVGYKFSL